MLLHSASRLAVRLRPLATSASSSSRLVLLTSAERAAMAPSSARELTVQVPTVDGLHVRNLEIFVVRGPDDDDASVPMRAYKNHCPHAGGPLNMFPDTFFRDGFLMCTRHAARFRWDDGVCVSPPCPGERLLPLEVEQCAEEGITVEVDALVALCEQGGGGSILKPIAEALGDGGVRIVPPR
eukprot:6571177-Prymnesium_polylepis.1